MSGAANIAASPLSAVNDFISSDVFLLSTSIGLASLWEELQLRKYYSEIEIVVFPLLILHVVVQLATVFRGSSRASESELKMAHRLLVSSSSR